LQSFFQAVGELDTLQFVAASDKDVTHALMFKMIMADSFEADGETADCA
jgi:hypothetical protein